MDDYSDINWAHEAPLEYFGFPGAASEFVSELLAELQILDPLRRGRWNNIGERVSGVHVEDSIV